MSFNPKINKMINRKLPAIFFAIALIACTNLQAQFGGIKVNTKSIGAIKKGVAAAVYSDADASRDAAEGVKYMDAHNTVAGPKDKYTIRLNKIFGQHKNEDGLSLNYKVYKVVDINAFACADGSVRVFSSLMDILTDNELLAIIGHEIGHVHNHDSRDAMKAALTRAALTDAATSQSGAVAVLNDTQLGAIAEAMMDSKHSRKQESGADDYSYAFMKKHNYNITGGYTAFMKFIKMEGEATTQSKFAKMMNSHPDSKKRAEEIKIKATKDGIWKEPVAEVPVVAAPAKKKKGK